MPRSFFVSAYMIRIQGHVLASTWRQCVDLCMCVWVFVCLRLCEAGNCNFFLLLLYSIRIVKLFLKFLHCCCKLFQLEKKKMNTMFLPCINKVLLTQVIFHNSTSQMENGIWNRFCIKTAIIL